MSDGVKKKFGKFELLGELARGGMGVVYKAYQKDLDRVVALKVLTSAKDQAVAVQGFLQEAKAAARLVHPNIVPIYDTGVESGQSYFTMEYVDGPNLAQYRSEAAPDLARLLEICRDVARAIQFAHEQGIVHRDIKPQNVLIPRAGRPKIADFGVASVLGTPPPPGRVMVPGTPGYMSPEQASGDPERVDVRSDIYSLGAVLYEALTGRLPFPGVSERDVIQRILRDELVPVRRIAPEVPPQVEAIVHQALEKDPSRRFPSAGAVADALDACLAAGVRPVQAPVPRAVSRVLGLPVPLGVVLLAVFAVGAGMYAYREYRAGVEERQKEARRQDEKRRKLEQQALARNFYDRSALLKGKAAYQALTLAIQEDPEFTDALVRRAQVATQLGLVDQAKSDLDRAIALSPQLAYAYYWRGILYQDRLDRPEKALADFAEVERLDPQSAIGFFAEGSALDGAQRYREAIDRFTKAIDRDPTSAVAFHRRGAARQAVGEDGPACEDYKKAVELEPGLAAAHHSLGLMLFAKEDLDEALASLDRAVETDPRTALYRLTRGHAHVTRKEFDAAIADFSHAIDRDSRLAPAFLGRARAYQSKGQLDSALRDLNFAVELAPAYPDPRAARGGLFFVRQLYARAAKDWERFLELAPDDARAPQIRRQLGVARERAKTRTEEEVRAEEALDAGTDAYLKKAYGPATTDLKRALTLNPALHAAKYTLACVYSAWTERETVAAQREAGLAEGLSWLAKAIESGFTSRADARTDPALSGLRADPRFEALLKEN
ncbi:MAG: protein kinase [Planctomycetes bacterium]|nr:protein kinase [Planctomycetota bacterium]